MRGAMHTHVRYIIWAIVWGITTNTPAFAQNTDVKPEVTLTPIVVTEDAAIQTANRPEVYTVGVQDVLTVSVLQPEQILSDCVVSPDGSITLPYINNVHVKGMTVDQVQQEVQNRLADGYLKYPSVVVSLKMSNSRRFFVYGEVIKPGPYPMEENTTVLRAISMSGGFTRFGSASRVKLLRPKPQGGYETMQINIKSVMEGDPVADILIKNGDIIVVSEGMI